MFDKMKQVMEFKKQADQLKRELEGITLEIEEVPGIKISITASQQFQSIQLDDQKIDLTNTAKLESDMLQSINSAMKRSQTEAAGIASKKMGGMPGLPGL